MQFVIGRHNDILGTFQQVKQREFIAENVNEKQAEMFERNAVWDVEQKESIASID